MKKRSIISVVIALTVIVGTLLFRLWPRTLSSEQCGALYQKYAGRDDIEASFIRGKRINDTVMADMTILKAVSDTGWAVLVHDFSLPVIPEEYEALFYSDTSQITIRQVPKTDPSQPTDNDILKNDVVAISFYRHSIYIFTINSTSQLKALLRGAFEYNLSLHEKP